MTPIGGPDDSGAAAGEEDSWFTTSPLMGGTLSVNNGRNTLQKNRTGAAAMEIGNRAFGGVGNATLRTLRAQYGGGTQTKFAAPHVTRRKMAVI